MPFCPKCGKEVSEKEEFCSNCGASLRPGVRPVRETRVEKAEKAEKTEKEEKREKAEKEEKREKEEASPIGPLVGGAILIFIGVTSYLATAGIISFQEIWPYFLVLLGLIIIIVAVYAGMIASKRHPKP